MSVEPFRGLRNLTLAVYAYVYTVFGATQSGVYFLTALINSVELNLNKFAIT